ncbi:tripartite motif-containing protein 55 [Myotis lucifugus]|uniref:tripartite motif-containing protein 55 n=1 Tax=Myotis lucifugus TaxID=59463 RepID=UPI000CCC6F7F|nr:tripartite motif-containing protein 55 [Myotis lucifugus]
MSASLNYKSFSKEQQTMDNLEKQLICPICLEMFTKPVVILPCQHNLCRKCASDIFQQDLETCEITIVVMKSREEEMLKLVALVKLQDTLVNYKVCVVHVSKIVSSIYKSDAPLLPAVARKVLAGADLLGKLKLGDYLPEKKSDQPRCEEHEEERINIYCLNCEVPTCSLCKIFGAHKDCQVAPLTHVFQRQKSELSDGIAVLVGSNDRVQGVISQLEDTCKTIEECCKKQKQELCEKFDYLYGILEERKNEMTQVITRTQGEKLEHVRALIKKYSDHLENVSKLVESGIQFMDEPEMAVFLQNAKTLLQKISEASKAFQMEKIEHGYENMNHFTVNLNREEKIIREIDFYREDEEEEEEGEGEGGEEEGGGDREEEGQEEEEEVKMEEVEHVGTEPSEEDESLEKALEPSQLASEVQAAPATLPVSSPEPSPALPPAADAPVTQGEVVSTGSLQTTESETPVPTATDTADPLLYPSWYKGQTRKATTNPPSTPVSEGLGHIGPPGSEDSSVQKAEVAEAAASERAAVSGKETSSPAATSQIGFEDPPLQGQAAASGSGNGADSEPARHIFSFSWLNSLNE